MKIDFYFYCSPYIKKKAEQTEHQLLYLDPLENWSCRANCHTKIIMNNSMTINLITDEMDQFLERHKENLDNLPKFTQDHLNRLIYSKEIESIINNFPKQKAPGSDGFTVKFYRIFKGKTLPIRYHLFQKIEYLTHCMRTTFP